MLAPGNCSAMCSAEHQFIRCIPVENKANLFTGRLLEQKDNRHKIFIAPVSNPDDPAKLRYTITGYNKFLTGDGLPAIAPPWGTLNAVDLNSGELVWKIPLGEYPALAAKGHRNTGTQLFGGGIVTAGGLVFIGASQDEKFRAFDKTTGKMLWEYQLPCGGYATPATYDVDGKQYVVIAAGGGGRQRTKAGDYYIAFALP